MVKGIRAVREIGAREYKVMLNHRAFAEPDRAVEGFRGELEELARGEGVTMKENFEPEHARWIVFLDTVDWALYHTGRVLRQRQSRKAGRTELTLKFMTPDRFFSVTAYVRPSTTKRATTKLEEDIGAPFQSRFAHSSTITARRGTLDTGATLANAIAAFPGLKDVRTNPRRLDSATPLLRVNDLRAFETVFTGPRVVLGGRKATLAVILWTERPKGPPLVAEFSFRYTVDPEGVTGGTATEAYGFYMKVQRMDWVRPSGTTKTQYVYRTGPNQ